MQDKSIFFRLPKSGKEGFLIENDRGPYFYDKLHYHPELQLKYIVEGTGDLFVGDTFVHFEPGDLFLIGSNQSHVFKSDPVYYEGNSDLTSHSISIFFQEESLGKGFFNIDEVSEIRRLIERSGRGLKFSKSVSAVIGERMLGIPDSHGFERFIDILRIFYDLATSEGYKYLATVNTHTPLSDHESEKVNDVINFILQNFKEDIKLEDVANIANYSQAAFCHFFKQHTRKTFVQFLIEVRVSKACTLLRNSNMNVSQICYDCGFNNVSNFNRQFKKITGLAPTSYIRKFKVI
jgi:AraC-like DNA-binding protein